MILVTGATGFLGEYVVRNLVDHYSAAEIRCFVRRTSNLQNLKPYSVDFAFGDLDEEESFHKALEGVKVLVNLASLGFGHAPVIVAACGAREIQRAIFISTTAIFTTLDASTKSVRIEAEELIQKSQISYTILRPTMIYGSERDRNISRLIRYLKKYPVIPVFGSGKFLQQPVFVQDVANAVVNSLQSESALRKAYNVAGLSCLTYDDLIDIVCKNLDRRRIKVHLPLRVSISAAKACSYLPVMPDFSVEQILRLNEDKVFDIKEAESDLGYRPVDFDTGIKFELDAMGFMRVRSGAN